MAGVPGDRTILTDKRKDEQGTEVERRTAYGNWNLGRGDGVNPVSTTGLVFYVELF